MTTSTSTLRTERIKIPQVDIEARARSREVMLCMGTRPEAIKLAPVVQAVQEHRELRPVVVATAQHRQMLDQMLEVFGIVPDVDLELMTACQSLHGLAGAAVAAVGDTIRAMEPAMVVVQGDTTTALCAAIAAAYSGVPVAHVEAGLRTGDVTSPFPEEHNRRLIGSIAALHFCPTPAAASNLLAEGIDANSVFVTGNTVIDALGAVHGGAHYERAAASLPPRVALRRMVVTMHRRETQGEVQRGLLEVIGRIVAQNPQLEVVMPVHLNPAVRDVVHAELGGHERIHLTEPLDYLSFIALLRSADFALSDSGGLQEEAPALDLPLLVMRDTTERPEGVDAGCVRLCGTDPEDVERELRIFLASPQLAVEMSAAPNPYGDGLAAGRIVETIAQYLDGRPITPASAPITPLAPAAGSLETETRT